MAHFIQRLNAAIRAKGSATVVGLDPRFDQLPRDLITIETRREKHPVSSEIAAAAYEEFCFRVIDVVAPLVPAVKPQAAFFEALGPAGTQALARVIRRARETNLIVICDAKRGDIGSTAEAYARGYLAGADPDAAPWGADAMTVNPYLGPDTLQPLVAVALEREAGIYVLVRTSNPRAGEFQDLVSGKLPHYRHVARVVDELAQQTRDDQPFGAVGAVVGATYPRELAELREAMPHTHLLIPGYGSQGGRAADVAAAFRDDGLGAIVNSSRGIIFAFNREPFKSHFKPKQWEAAIEAATREMNDDLAANTPVGLLRS